MANGASPHSGPDAPACLADGRFGKGRPRSSGVRKQLCWFLAAIILLAPAVFSQGSGPHVATVAPSSGKVNDQVTLTGENLDKKSVAAVFLSDDANDYKAAVVDQTGQKIIMQVPQVKPGDYNVSLQVGDKILILPIRFKVQ
jgi:IPT/TIG domain